MKRARALLLAVLGLALPAGLALAVYLTSAGPLEAVPAAVSVPSPQIARPAATTTERATSRQDTTTGREREERDDDLPGKCEDPKHRLDPDCDPRFADADDDSSGPGSGEDDSSGHGSGDDDADDSSGHGSGDDD